jgi:hypothetical protein
MKKDNLPLTYKYFHVQYIMNFEELILNNFYITVTSDQIDLDEKIISANDILLRRIKSKKFPIYNSTGNRNNIKVDDICYMYIAGTKHNKHHILGSFRIKEIILNNFIEEFEDVLSNIPYKNFIMDDIRLFTKPIYVKEIIQELEFIKSKDKWGVFFQGGFIKIGQNDMRLLESKIANS